MKTSNFLHNKRIAKNTVFLYIRMLFILIVGLYTSRVYLQALGIVDYGIYCVIGGIAALFSFITASMSQTIQRFITYELGKGKKGNVSRAFSVGIELQIVISILIMVCVEIVGIWMIENKLNIPADRMQAAYILLQCSVFTIPISLLSSPYNALIIAHERMQAFACISIFEVIAKLLIAYALIYSSFDHLILYGLLSMLVMVLVRLCYVVYCKTKIPHIVFTFAWDLTEIKNMLSFAGWNMYGALSYVGFTQGLNVLLNIFFLPTVNAARGIAVQVQTAIYGFVLNFQTAINPQITKTYADNDLYNMNKLIIRSAKFSLLLLAILSMPILFETTLLLKFWLEEVPECTVVFIRIIVLTSWITAIENPITNAVLASGQVKKYQLIVSTVRLCIVPISYSFLKFGFAAYVVFVIHFCVEALVLIVRLVLVRQILGFPVLKFINQAVIKTVVSIGIGVLFIIPLYIFMNQGVLRIILITLCFVILMGLTAYFILLDESEQNFVKKIVSKVVSKNENSDNITIQS